MRLQADPAIRERLPSLRGFLKFYAALGVVVIAILVVAATVEGPTALAVAALAPIGPIACEVYLGVRFWRLGSGWLRRYWRAMTTGVALSGCAFAALAVSRVVPSDVPLVVQGVAVPSAAFFVLYALWVRLQGTRGAVSTIGFFDVAIVVISVLAYGSFFLTAPYVTESGAEGALGAIALIACGTMLVFLLVLLGRRPRVDGVSTEQVLALSIGTALAGTALVFVWSFVSGRGAVEAAPPWFFGGGWALAFGIGVLAPFAETLRPAPASETDDAVRVRPYWPYAVLAVTSPLVIWTLVFGSGEQKGTALVGFLLVVEVLVVRQLVLIGAQRTARERQRELKELAAAEAARTNVLLDLALSLSTCDDAAAMCAVVGSAVPRLVDADAVLVLARSSAGPIVASSRGDAGVDAATVWMTLEQLDLSGARPVRIGSAWAGLEGGGEAVVAAVVVSGGERLGYVLVRPAGTTGADTADLLEGVVHQLALALDRAALVQQVKQNEARVREVVDLLEEGVADLDRDRVVRTCNEAFAAFVESEVEEVTGRPFPPHILELVDSARLVDELQDGAVVSETEFTLASGARKEYEFTMLPRRGDHGSGAFEGVLVVARDVAYERRERRELLRLLDDLVLAGGAEPAPAPAAGDAAALAAGLAGGPQARLRALAQHLDALVPGESAAGIVAGLQECTAATRSLLDSMATGSDGP